MSLPQKQDPCKTIEGKKRPEPLSTGNRAPSTGHPTTSIGSSMTSTFCSTLTGAGRGAVAVIAVEGRDALPIVAKCFRAAREGELLPSQVRYGTWCGIDGCGIDADKIAGESVVVTPIDGDLVEIHCHGGIAAVARILDDLRAAGVTRLPPAGWLVRDRCRLIDEASEILTRCLTARTAGIAMDQVRGAMRDWANRSLQSIQQGIASEEAIRGEAESILRSAPLGLRLTEPFRVVLLGPPNVGKSTLLNSLVGYDRSITFDGAGTTRDILHAETVIDGWLVKLTDTAGIRETVEPIEKEGVRRARIAADQADLLLCISEPARIDATAHTANPDSRATNPDFQPPESCCRIPLIRVLNKVDLWSHTADQSNLEQSKTSHGSNETQAFDLCTNAVTGEGIEMLLQMISRRLARVVPEPGEPVPISQWQVERLTEISKSMNRQQLEDALNLVLEFEAVSEDP